MKGCFDLIRVTHGPGLRWLSTSWRSPEKTMWLTFLNLPWALRLPELDGSQEFPR